MWIAHLSAFILCIVFGIALYGAIKEIKQFKVKHSTLQEQTNWFKEELVRHLDDKLTVVLTLQERRMILNALESFQFKARITEPSTKRYIRDLYRQLMETMKKSIASHKEKSSVDLNRK